MIKTIPFVVDGGKAIRSSARNCHFSVKGKVLETISWGSFWDTSGGGGAMIVQPTMRRRSPQIAPIDTVFESFDIGNKFLEQIPHWFRVRNP